MANKHKSKSYGHFVALAARAVLHGGGFIIADDLFGLSILNHGVITLDRRVIQIIQLNYLWGNFIYMTFHDKRMTNTDFYFSRFCHRKNGTSPRGFTFCILLRVMGYAKGMATRKQGRDIDRKRHREKDG